MKNIKKLRLIAFCAVLSVATNASDQISDHRIDSVTITEVDREIITQIDAEALKLNEAANRLNTVIEEFELRMEEIIEKFKSLPFNVYNCDSTKELKTEASLSYLSAFKEELKPKVERVRESRADVFVAVKNLIDKSSEFNSKTCYSIAIMKKVEGVFQELDEVCKNKRTEMIDSFDLAFNSDQTCLIRSSTSTVSLLPNEVKEAIVKFFMTILREIMK